MGFCNIDFPIFFMQLLRFCKKLYIIFKLLHNINYFLADVYISQAKKKQEYNTAMWLECNLANLMSCQICDLCVLSGEIGLGEIIKVYELPQHRWHPPRQAEGPQSSRGAQLCVPVEFTQCKCQNTKKDEDQAIHQLLFWKQSLFIFFSTEKCVRVQNNYIYKCF